MSPTDSKTPYILRLAYQRPKAERLRRIAVVKPRDNDIFISYPAQDGEFVRRLDKSIREHGFDPWIDFDDISNFDISLNDVNHYTHQIKSGIRGADVFVLVLSQSALNCEKTMEELRLAQRLNKLIILLCKDPLSEFDEVQRLLDDLQYLDFTSSINTVFEQVALNIIHLQTYVRLLARATEWDRQKRPQSYLLTPEDLKEVKKQKLWIETHELGEQFQFTKLQKEFLDTVNKAHETSEYFGKSPPDIFVSYARSNESFVEDLNKALKDARWKVWIDQDRIPVAANWRDEAEEGIRYAHTLIFIVCPKSLISKNCQWELEKARKYKKRVIPVVSHNEYDRDIFHEIGFSSIQYVSFARKNQSFRASLETLLGALKEDLEDLKTYRRLLLKSYEWSERERSDVFLMSRQEYKEIQNWCKQRQNIRENDKRELEPLLARQKEYIQASQRYLALQRKRQSFLFSAILGVFGGLFVLLLSSTFNEIRALVKSLDDLKGLDALVTGLQAGKRVQSHDLFVSWLRPNLRAKAITALHRTSLKLREINRLEGHRGKVFSVAFSPDAQQFVSIGADKTVRFWSLQQNEKENNPQWCENIKMKEIGYHAASVKTVAYSSDGQFIATGDTDGTVKLWHCDGQLYKTLPKTHSERVNHVDFSPGSQYLASASKDGQILLWTRYDQFTEPIMLEHRTIKSIETLSFSFNGQYLASADSEGYVYLWKIKHGHQNSPSVELEKVFSHEATGKGKNLTTLTFSPDSLLLAFAGVSGSIQIQDLKHDKTRLLREHDGVVTQIAFSADGSTLASASFDETVRLWDLRKDDGKELIHTLRGHQGPVFRLAFGPQDEVLATGGADGIVRLWLRDKGSQIEAFEGHEDQILGLAFSPKPMLPHNTTLISSSGDGNIRLWDIDSPIKPLPHNRDVFDVTFRPDGQVIASGGAHTLRLWRRDGTLRSHLVFAATRVDVQAVDYSPNGEILAAGGSNGQIRLWKPDINTEEPIQIIDAHTGPGDGVSGNNGVLDLSFSSDGKWLASGGTDRTLKLWMMADGRLSRYTTRNADGNVTAVAFSDDSQLLATSFQKSQQAHKGEIVVWKLPDRSEASAELQPKFSNTLRHDENVLTVAIQPQGADVMASGDDEGKIKLWNASGKLIKTLNEHSGPVTKVSFSNDGLFLASSSEDGTVRLWTAQGELISVLERHRRAVSSVEFGPEPRGEFLASSSSDADVLLWKLWDLSGRSITPHNQHRQILRMLVSNGCQSISPFLEAHTGVTQKEFSNFNQSEQEFLAELKQIEKLCNPTIQLRKR